MSLDAALSIARGGLSHIQRQLAQSADNVANAGTAGHTRKSVEGRAAVAGTASFGVRSLEAQRDVDAAVVGSMNDARSAQAAAAAREAILQPIERAQGDPALGESVADLTGALRTTFIALRESPEEQPQQRLVVSAAQELATRYNEVSDAVGAARQGAHDGMVRDVGTLNAALRQVAKLNEQIVPLAAQGLSTATLEDQRDTAIASVSEILEVKVVPGGDGSVALIGRGGLSLPLRTQGDPFSLANATIGPEAYHGTSAAGVPGSIPGVMLDGLDVTGKLAGGRVAEYAKLRDEDLPLQQAELDVSASALASRLGAQGLRLFTGPAGTVPDLMQPYGDPASGMLGFAGSIRVSASVVADPSTVRDGNTAVAAGAGGALGFTPNPVNGPAAFGVLIDRVLNYSFGAQVSPTAAQANLPAAGLGPTGTLRSRLGGGRTLEDYAGRLVANHTADRAAATAAKEQAGSLLGGLQQRFNDRSGVNVDSEMAAMVTLQNAYAANARIMSTVQSMYDALFAIR